MVPTRRGANGDCGIQEYKVMTRDISARLHRLRVKIRKEIFWRNKDKWVREILNFTYDVQKILEEYRGGL